MTLRVVSGHQPTYLPWLGLIHKASLSDVFVYMDDVQYLSQDWNNRNKIKTSLGQSKWLSVPVDLKNSDGKLLKDILIASEENLSEKQRWYTHHWATLQSSYGKCPYFKTYRDFFHWIYMEKRWKKLSDLNLTILKQIFEWFNITSEIKVASDLKFQNKKSDLVLEHAEHFKADVVVCGALGKNYIRMPDFESKGIKVYFQDYQHPSYNQPFGNFLSHLSFVDLLFNRGPEAQVVCFDNNIKKEDLCRSLN